MPVDDLLDPAAARVDDDAMRSRSSTAIAAKSSPDVAIASWPAPIAKWMNRLIRRAILRSIAIVGSKPLTSAAMRTSRSDASNDSDGARPGDAVERLRQ